jgi:sialate O-acetylesterase
MNTSGLASEISPIEQAVWNVSQFGTMGRRGSLIMRYLFLVGIALAGLASPARADVHLGALFSPHMVLQKSPKTVVWGTAAPNEKIKVTLGTVTAETAAGQDGAWRIDLDLSKSAPGPFSLDVQGQNLVTIPDVMVGEVWLCSGQSNMEFPLAKALGAETEIARADPRLRQFLVMQTPASAPASDCKGSWQSATPATTGRFTAVGYYFGRDLEDKLNEPVALINSSVGNTAIEAWMSADALAQDPDLKAGAAHQLEKARTASLPPPDAQASVPAPPPAPGKPKKLPSYLFNGMIHPLIPFTIRGVVWYQGENNAERARQYQTSFPLLISSWRQLWGEGDFPFYFCQLAGYHGKYPEPTESEWAELREAQDKTLSVANTGEAVLIDLGETWEIHPRNKKDVGARLAALALARTYGVAGPSEGPRYDGMSVEGATIRVRFKPTDGGLVTKPLPDIDVVSTTTNKTEPLVHHSPGGPVEGFALCGADHKWFWADSAVIDRTSVVVESKEVPTPVAVRYAWANTPTCNLYNGAGFPAPPFRSDDFPGKTDDAKFGLTPEKAK